MIPELSRSCTKYVCGVPKCIGIDVMNVSVLLDLPFYFLPIWTALYKYFGNTTTADNWEIYEKKKRENSSWEQIELSCWSRRYCTIYIYIHAYMCKLDWLTDTEGFSRLLPAILHTHYIHISIWIWTIWICLPTYQMLICICTLYFYSTTIKSLRIYCNCFKCVLGFCTISVAMTFDPVSPRCP